MRSGRTWLVAAALSTAGNAWQGRSAEVPIQQQLPRGFPSSFPLPPDRAVEHAAAGLGEFTLSMRVTSAANALAFYREALPRAGYRTREGALRPRGAAGAGQVRFVGGLIFTAGSGDEESDPGGLEAFAYPDGDRLELSLPRVGVPPAAKAPPRTRASGEPLPRPGPPQPSGPGAYASLTLPPEFPWPPSYKNASFARDAQGVLTGRLDVPAGPQTYDFYQAALAQAGYRVREVWRPDDRADVFLGRLAFEGHGRTGRLTVASDATAGRLTVRLAGGAKAR